MTLKTYKKGYAFLERYRVVEQLSSGSESSFYRVEDLSYAGQFFLLKVYDSELITSAEQKETVLKTLSNLRLFSHPNLQSIYDFGFSENLELFLILENVEAGSLKNQIGRAVVDNPIRPYSLNQALGVLYQSLLAINYLHEKGILHLSICPENIYFTSSAELKLDLSSILNLSKSPSVNYYSAPEVLGGEELSPSSDLYSLATISYELLTGKLPFDFNSLENLLEFQKERSFPEFASEERGVPKWFETFIFSCTAFSATDRLPSAQAAALAIAKESSFIKNQLIFSDFVDFNKNRDEEKTSVAEKEYSFGKASGWQLGIGKNEHLSNFSRRENSREKRPSFVLSFLNLSFISLATVAGIFVASYLNPELGDKLITSVGGPVLNVPRVIEIQKNRKAEIEEPVEAQAIETLAMIVEPTPTQEAVIPPVVETAMAEEPEVIEIAVAAGSTPEQVAVEPKVAETTVVAESTSTQETVEITPLPTQEPTPAPTPIETPKPTLTPTRVPAVSALLKSESIEIIQKPSAEVIKTPTSIQTPIVIKKAPPSIIRLEKPTVTPEEKETSPFSQSFSGTLVTITSQQERIIRDLSFTYRLNGENATGTASISSLGNFRLSGKVVERGFKFTLQGPETWVTLVGGQEVDGLIRGFYVISSEGTRGSWEVRRQ